MQIGPCFGEEKKRESVGKGENARVDSHLFKPTPRVVKRPKIGEGLSSGDEGEGPYGARITLLLLPGKTGAVKRKRTGPYKRFWSGTSGTLGRDKKQPNGKLLIVQMVAESRLRKPDRKRK